jgi:hypothetical protein
MKKARLSKAQKDHIVALGAVLIEQQIAKGASIPLVKRDLLGCFLNALVCLRERWPTAPYREDSETLVECFLRGVDTVSRIR